MDRGNSLTIKYAHAAVLVKTGEPLKIMVLKIPKLQSGQVLVKVAYSGVCHTQILEMDGKKGIDRFLPHTLGHEGSGIVIKTGAGVEKVKPGDHVVLSWIKGRGADIPSSVYESEYGQINSGAISTFLDYSIISENRLTPIKKEIPLKIAALLGCAIPTGAGIVLNSIGLRPGNSIAIFGVGGIGASIVIAADLMAAAKIIAIDIYDHKLEHARSLGATDTINARKQNCVTEIYQITGGIGVDFAIESAGKRETMEMAFRVVRDMGGLCVLAGNLPQGEQISIDPFDLIKGKRIVGTWGGETKPDRDIPLYVDLYIKGRLKLENLITHCYSLEEINTAIEDLKSGKIGRALIDMDL
jgi:S-(hydroxymethyl)glutathione dehydrogenase/alcohol dehydrogenase